MNSGPGPEFGRVEAMVERVRLDARAVLGEAGSAAVAAALGAALAYRCELIADDHDPRMLHPARTVRILLSDGGCADVATLSAAAFTDSVDRELVGDARVLGDTGALIVQSVPFPDPSDPDDALLERLVSAERDVALISLVERLDHARHLHLRDDIAWRPFHAGIVRDYIPAARWLAPSLARRFERWADAFERRLLLRS